MACSSASTSRSVIDRLVGGQSAIDLVAGAGVGVLAAGPQPVLAVLAIDGRPGQVQLGRPVGHRVVGHDEVLIDHQLVDQGPRRQVVEDPDLAQEVLDLPGDLVVEDELGQAEDEQEVEHPGAGHGVDAGQCREQGAGERLGAGLRVEDLGVRERHVRLAGQAQGLGHGDVGDVEMERLDGGHRRRGGLHVEGGRGAAEEHGALRAG